MDVVSGAEEMRIVVVTPDVVGARMAGPGIRAWHVSEELATRFDVTLVARSGEEVPPPAGVRRSEIGSREAKDAVRRADLVITQPGTRLSGARDMIYDLFAPVMLELDEVVAPLVSRVGMKRLVERRRLKRALRVGRRFIVATEAQRSLYQNLARRWGIGVDDSEWIVVPFGVPSTEPRRIARESPPTFVWNGGVWPWLDADTAVEAIRLLRSLGLDAKLRFLGARRPGADGALESVPIETDEAAIEWNDGWVRYLDRDLELGRATGAVMLHRETREAQFSIRTRFFDALWCRVPVIASRGGWVADLVEQHEIGFVVQPGDTRAVASAMEVLATDHDYHARFVKNAERLRSEMEWSRVVAPLVDAIEEFD